jgi:ferredoxin-thioredoxin reductase catalytic chain
MTSTASSTQDKALEAMKNFAEQYAKRTDTYFCIDPSVTAVVIEGLAKNKQELGSPLCPCRHYEDKEAEVKNTFWNCPCVPMRERKECHCMLFIRKDQDFVGELQEISLEEIEKVRQSMKS